MASAVCFAAEEGCYKIFDEQSLYLFASQAKNSSMCATLEADIVVNKNVLNDDGTLNTNQDYKAWTPIQNYSGSFDGQGYTISGLYVKSDGDDVGFFATTGTSATITNLGIVDSYFYGKNRVGAFVGQANGQLVVSECFNKSTVEGDSQLGGILGYTATNLSIEISNSYNAGRVHGSGQAAGFVGYLGSEANLSVVNCYNTGSIEGFYATAGVVGVNGGTSEIINSFVYENFLGDSWGHKASIIHSFYLSANDKQCSGEKGDVCPATKDEFSSGEVAAKLSEYNEVVNDVEIDGSVWGQLADEDHPTINSDGSGYSYAKVKNKTVVTLDGEKAESLVIPRALSEADSLIFDRSFTVGVYSTIVLPFSKVAKEIKGTEFYRFGGVNYVESLGENAATWYQLDPDETIKANVPYVVMPSVSRIEIKGVVEFDKAGIEDVVVRSWTFRGVYDHKVWQEGDEELGRVFGFAASEKDMKQKDGTTTHVVAGDFVKAGAGAGVRPLRAYLLYTPADADEARPGQVMKKPAAVVDESATNHIPSVFYKSKIAEEPVVEADIETAEIEPSESEVKAAAPTAEKSGSEKSKESTTAIRVKDARVQAPGVNAWYDIRGRKMLRKPTARGTYYNKVAR